MLKELNIPASVLGGVDWKPCRVSPGLRTPPPFGDLELRPFAAVNQEHHSSSESAEPSQQTGTPEGAPGQQRALTGSLEKEGYDLHGGSGKGFPGEVLPEESQEEHSRAGQGGEGRAPLQVGNRRGAGSEKSSEHRAGEKGVSWARPAPGKAPGTGHVKDSVFIPRLKRSHEAS